MSKKKPKKKPENIMQEFSLEQAKLHDSNSRDAADKVSEHNNVPQVEAQYNKQDKAQREHPELQSDQTNVEDFIVKIKQVLHAYIKDDLKGQKKDVFTFTNQQMTFDDDDQPDILFSMDMCLDSVFVAYKSHNTKESFRFVYANRQLVVNDTHIVDTVDECSKYLDMVTAFMNFYVAKKAELYKK